MTAPVLTEFGHEPPVIYMLENEQYHAAKGVSRSDLWTIWTKTPAHLKFAPARESAPMKLGSAADCAILEPESFETKFECGPDARGNSNVWKDAAAAAEANGRTLLKPAEYEAALCIRESAHSLSCLRGLLDGARCQQAAFVVDDETGLLLKSKPDILNENRCIIADIKTAADASPAAFARSVGTYGYHVQEAYYSDVWSKVAQIDAFAFIVIESSPPYLTAIYELTPEAVAEGRAIYREALRTYAECEASDQWPGYADKVQSLDLCKWDYQLTRPEADL